METKPLTEIWQRREVATNNTEQIGESFKNVEEFQDARICLAKLGERGKSRTECRTIYTNGCKNQKTKHICVALATGLPRKPLIFLAHVQNAQARARWRGLARHLHRRLAVPLGRARRVRAL